MVLIMGDLEDCHEEFIYFEITFGFLNWVLLTVTLLWDKALWGMRGFTNAFSLPENIKLVTDYVPHIMSS